MKLGWTAFSLEAGVGVLSQPAANARTRAAAGRILRIPGVCPRRHKR
jgi:hypothetical protein